MITGDRSAAGGSHVEASAVAWSPERMSFTSSGAPSAPGNQTNGTPRRSAKRICLPNLAAVGATSVAMPRLRRAVAIRSQSRRRSSCGSATTTHVGTERVTPSAFWPNSSPSRRETPIEMPTPGNRSLPDDARFSYRPPEQTEPNRSYPCIWVS